MATCYKCGGEIEFYHNGFNAVPIHASGGCSASGSSHGYGGGWRWVEREAETGQRFIFGWVEYPSYVNPNAACPRCGKSVYFYQSPLGGRVYFNNLGPPWPKHGPSPWECPDKIVPLEEHQEISQTTEISPSTTAPEWQKHGWNPFLLMKVESTGGGIVINGSKLLENSETTEHRLIQADLQDTFHESQGDLVFSYSMAMNSSRLISVLTENIVFIRFVSEAVCEFSTISVDKDNEVIRFKFRMKVS
jgi:hypothetical protein